VIGAGPAGLAAAHTAVTEGLGTPTVVEQDSQVGGLSKTVEYRGFRCDIGGHRFFTKNQQVDTLWRETLPSGLLRRPRLSRIYYGGKLFHYPLRLLNVLRNLGPEEGARMMVSFARARLFPRRPELSFEDWVSNRFGSRLFSVFFRSYTEKVWGIPCADLSADWAAQRIRDLDLGKAILHAMGLNGNGQVASLIDEFDYPELGPGQMYEALADRVVSGGGRLLLRHAVEGIRHDGRRVIALELATLSGRQELEARNVVSTMPLTELVLRMRPAPPSEVVAAARALTYRSIITVNLMLDRLEALPDTWLYLHAPEILAGRLQVYRNWSPAMTPGPECHSLGLEYFGSQGNGLWANSDEALLELGKKDLVTLGLATRADIFDGLVLRYAKAYPVYREGYAERVSIIRDYLSGFENLQCAGRYGQFRYNNMDHSIMTGVLAVRRLAGEPCDPWSVNADGIYHEQR
jgi:protoporphyrinogen oxidase